MDNHRNADALEVLDVAIKRVSRRIPDAIAERRSELIEQYGKGNALAGTGGKKIAKMLNELLDDALREIPVEAIKYAGDRDAALTEFRGRLLALVEEAQRHMDAHWRFITPGGNLSPRMQIRVRELLDESRHAVGATMTMLRGGPEPVAISPQAIALPPAEREEEWRRVANALDLAGVKIRDVTASSIADLWDYAKGKPPKIGSITAFMTGGAKGRPKKCPAVKMP